MRPASTPIGSVGDCLSSGRLARIKGATGSASALVGWIPTQPFQQDMMNEQVVASLLPGFHARPDGTSIRLTHGQSPWHLGARRQVLANRAPCGTMVLVGPRGPVALGSPQTSAFPWCGKTVGCSAGGSGRRDYAQFDLCARGGNRPSSGDLGTVAGGLLRAVRRSAVCHSRPNHDGRNAAPAEIPTAIRTRGTL
jgi:hypothetical protein